MMTIENFKSNKWFIVVFIIIFTAAIFISNFFVPMGLVVWMFFIIPILVVYWSMPAKYLLPFTALISILILINLFFDNSLISFHYALINRIAAIFFFFLLAILLRYQKTTREKIIESEADYRSLFENMQQGAAYCRMYYKDNLPYDFKYIKVNENFEKLSGLKDVTGKYISDIVPGIRQSDDKIFEIYGRVALLGTPEKFEMFVKALNDWYYISVYSPKKEYFVAIFDVITQRKENEERLKENEEQLNLFFNNSPDAQFIIQENGLFVKCNQIAISRYGYTSEELLTMTPRDLAAPNLRDKVLPKIKAALQQETHFNWDHLTKSSLVFPVEVFTKPITIKDKPHIIVTVRDITAQKQYETELIKLKEKAEESDRLKTAFLANMSHEIRTPLNGIMGFSELLKESDLDSQKTIEYIDIINSSGVQLMNIINELVDISVIESGQISLHETLCSPKTVLQDVYNIYKNEIYRDCNNIINYSKQKKEIEFNLLIPSELEDLLIKVDSSKLMQILSSLVSNAIKFTIKGKIQFGYKIINRQAATGNWQEALAGTRHSENLKQALADKQKEIIFFVEDTGIGISKEKQPLIFDRFRQLEYGNTRNYGGLGLGLSICKSLIEKMGGQIWLESEENKGTIFYFTLPLKSESPVQGEYIKPEIKNPKQIINLTGKTILIVEDDNNNFYFLKLLFSKTGVTVFHVENGNEAVEFCHKNEKIHLILMDIQMSYMDGYEATTEIKKFRKDIPIIALTARAMNDDREKVFKAGCDDYMAKPVNKETLFRTIEKWIK